ncbi:2,3-diaminopropionate biosynthesis protein SbnA [Micromonospora sp. LOL_025]|uniref:2,3-diaminopropionate biosynthesis protein SbnA n=1 Tax=Micromonospora sp. LOL_025 TaxID=3345413 RepID=UPI003A8B28DD
MATIVTDPLDFNIDELYVGLRELFGWNLYLKCEGFNFAGSVKLKAAIEMVESMEREGGLSPEDTLIESSSGNMGVALSMVAARKGYRFVCVTDIRCTLAARRLMAALGAVVHVVTDRDEQQGFLSTRLALVRRLCESNDNFVWLNQYANSANWNAHYRKTGPDIARAFPNLDVLFVGAGTTGTLMGCARYFKSFRPEVTVVAVDAAGSVSFGGPPGERLLPGLGTSVRPSILDESYVDDIVHVSEPEAIAACHRLGRSGFLFGGSTGTVVHGAVTWLRQHRGPAPTAAVAIAPDLGGNYADTVYDPDWLHRSYGSRLADLPLAPLPWDAETSLLGGQGSSWS